MKYQLLLTIYLLTITYCAVDPCEAHGTSAECTADTANSCGWTAKASPTCVQKTTVTCPSTPTQASDCTSAGACEYEEVTTGSCANSKNDAACETAKSDCANTPGCTGNESSCTAKTDVCNTDVEATCTADASTNGCAWSTAKVGICKDACASLANDACTGKSSLCSWVTGTCQKTGNQEQKENEEENEENEEEKKEEGSGAGSGSGAGTGTGTGGNGSDPDSSNYVKFGNYLLVLFLFLF